MKKSILMVAMAISSLCSLADTLMTVQMNDESTVTFPFTEKPVVTFVGDKMVVNSTEGVQTFMFDNIQKITYTRDEVATPISESVVNNGIALNGNSFVVSNLKENDIVMMCTTSGANVKAVQANAAGVAIIDITTLPQEVIIVKTPNASFKIIR